MIGSPLPNVGEGFGGEGALHPLTVFLVENKFTGREFIAAKRSTSQEERCPMNEAII